LRGAGCHDGQHHNQGQQRIERAFHLCLLILKNSPGDGDLVGQANVRYEEHQVMGLHLLSAQCTSSTEPLCHELRGPKGLLMDQLATQCRLRSSGVKREGRSWGERSIESHGASWPPDTTNVWTNLGMARPAWPAHRTKGSCGTCPAQARRPATRTIGSSSGGRCRLRRAAGRPTAIPCTGCRYTDSEAAPASSSTIGATSEHLTLNT